MKRMILALIMFGMSVAVFASEIGIMDASTKMKSTLMSTSWSLPAVGSLQLFKNTSSVAVNILYTVDYDSDLVVVRCPMNDAPVQRNSSRVCWIPPGEVARVQLNASSFIHGASGTFAILA